MSVDGRLLDNELVSKLSDSEKATLVDMAIARSYEVGDIIFKEYDEAYSVILLLKGRVGLLMEVGNSRELMVGQVHAGEITAWSGLVPPYAFTATGRAIEDCDVAIFKSEDLRRLFDENPRFGHVFMQQIACSIAGRLRDTHLQLLGLFGS